jgi:hypothetical protein
MPSSSFLWARTIAGPGDARQRASASEEAFREIRHRLIAEGAHATDGGLVTDMGAMWSLSFHDPDGGWHEVMWVKPDASLDDMTRPDEWVMIDPD